MAGVSFSKKAQTQPRRIRTEKIDVQIDIAVLHQLSLIFLSKNKFVTVKLKRKILVFLEIINEAKFKDDIETMWRYKLALAIADSVVNKSAKNIGAISSCVLENPEYEEYFTDFFSKYCDNVQSVIHNEYIPNEISDEDIIFLDDYISKRLRFTYLWKYAPLLRDIADKIDSASFDLDIESFNENTLENLDRLSSLARNAKSLGMTANFDFRVSDLSFDGAIDSTLELKARKHSKIRTGSQLLNKMLNGGFEGSRVYVFLGRSGKLYCPVAARVVTENLSNCWKALRA